MNNRAASSLVKACGALALVMVALLAGGDALRSVAAMHEAHLLLARTQHALNNLTLTLLDASSPQAGRPDRVDSALASLARDAASEPALLAPLRELEDRVRAYRAAPPGARAE